MASHKSRHICEVNRQRAPKMLAADCVVNGWVFLSFRSWESLARVSARWPRFDPRGFLSSSVKGIVAMPVKESQLHLKSVSVLQIWDHNAEKLNSYDGLNLTIKGLGPSQLKAYIDSIADSGN